MAETTHSVNIILNAQDKAKAAIGGVMDGLKGLASTAAGLATAGLAAAAGGALALGGALASCATAAADSQQVQAQLNAVLESTKGAAGVSADMANELAASLQKMTRFEDDSILSGENMLLTFTNIGKDVFPAATQTMLDMAQAMGGDLKGTAIQLGKALQDPIKGVAALADVGVNFTEAQKAMIAQMVAAGDVAGAQKFILQELQTEFGGSAVAAGQTFAGQLDILKNRFGDIQESIGMAILPLLTDLAGALLTALNNPAVQAGIDGIVSGITALAGGLTALVSGDVAGFMAGLNGAIMSLAQGFGMSKESASGLTAGVQGVLATITALSDSILSGIGPSITGLAQVFTTQFLPTLEYVRGQLVDGLAFAFQWISANIIPFLIAQFNTVSAWFVENGPLISSFVEVVIQGFQSIAPHVLALWGIIAPILGGIVDLILGLAKVIMQVATGDWAGAWATIQATVEKVWLAVQAAFVGLANWVTGWFGTTWAEVVAQWQSNWEMFQIIVGAVIGPITDAISGISDAIRGVIDWIGDMANRLNSLSLPAWLTPGSPTPFEMGLRGIADAMGALPTDALRVGVNGIAGGAPAGGGSPALAAGGASGLRQTQAAGGIFNISVSIGSVSEGSAYDAGQQAGRGIVSELRRQGVLV